MEEAMKKAHKMPDYILKEDADRAIADVATRANSIWTDICYTTKHTYSEDGPFEHDGRIKAVRAVYEAGFIEALYAVQRVMDKHIDRIQDPVIQGRMGQLLGRD